MMQWRTQKPSAERNEVHHDGSYSDESSNSLRHRNPTPYLEAPATATNESKPDGNRNRPFNWQALDAVEFYCLVFTVCAGWSVLVLLLLKWHKFPTQKHILEAICMIAVPIAVTFIFVFMIDRFVSKPR
jgi:hypothetical protein